MKRLLLSAFLATAIAPVVTAQTGYLQTDFSGGIPSDFVLADEDGLEPSIDMKDVGFATGLPWISMTEAGKDNNCAVSTSWYRKAGTSDDWMITPAVKVGSRQAVLRWNAKAGDKEYRDGYAVYVAEGCSAPADFKKMQPVFSIAKESAAWTQHEVSLAEFEGKSVRIAFVNNSRDCHTLYVDDLFVGIPAALEISSSISPIINREGNIIVSGEVRNIGTADVDSFTIRYRFGSGNFMEQNIAEAVKAGATKAFSFATDCMIQRDETLPYELEVKSGDDTSSVTGQVSCYYRRIVAEEVTGTWCGYCVRGIVAMRDMKEKYPDSFLGIAVHGSASTWTDPMDYSDYTNYLFDTMGMSGYPHASVNRSKLYTGDPANIEKFYTLSMERDLVAAATLKLDSYDEESGSYDIHADIHFTAEIEKPDFGIAYVLIENNVGDPNPGTDKDGNTSIYNGWEQNNYYAGAEQGSMGGFESLPSVVPGTQMIYQDVARAFWGDGFAPFDDSLSLDKAEANVTYTHEYSFTMPDNVMDIKNTELAALLINRKTGEIVNADVIPLHPDYSEVKDIMDGNATVAVSVANGMIKVKSDTMIQNVTIYDAGGMTVGQQDASGFDSCVDANLTQGLYLVTVVTDKGTTVKKVMI